AVVVAVLSLNGRWAPPASAAPFFSRQAQVAAGQPAPQEITPGQYYYVKTQGAGLETSAIGGQRCDELVPFVAETWTGTDGSGRSTSINGEPTYPSDEDKQTCESIGPH